jgi:hypothetical protein
MFSRAYVVSEVGTGQAGMVGVCWGGIGDESEALRLETSNAKAQFRQIIVIRRLCVLSGLITLKHGLPLKSALKTADSDAPCLPPTASQH